MSLMTLEEQGEAFLSVFMPVFTEAGRVADETGDPVTFGFGMWDVPAWPGTFEIPVTMPPCKSRSRR